LENLAVKETHTLTKLILLDSLLQELQIAE